MKGEDGVKYRLCRSARLNWMEFQLGRDRDDRYAVSIINSEAHRHLPLVKRSDGAVHTVTSQV